MVDEPQCHHVAQLAVGLGHGSLAYDDLQQGKQWVRPGLELLLGNPPPLQAIEDSFGEGAKEIPLVVILLLWRPDGFFVGFDRFPDPSLADLPTQADREGTHLGLNFIILSVGGPVGQDTAVGILAIGGVEDPDGGNGFGEFLEATVLECLVGEADAGKPLREFQNAGIVGFEPRNFSLSGRFRIRQPYQHQFRQILQPFVFAGSFEGRQSRRDFFSPGETGLRRMQNFWPILLHEGDGKVGLPSHNKLHQGRRLVGQRVGVPLKNGIQPVALAGPGRETQHVVQRPVARAVGKPGSFRPGSEFTAGRPGFVMIPCRGDPDIVDRQFGKPPHDVGELVAMNTSPEPLGLEGAHRAATHHLRISLRPGHITQMMSQPEADPAVDARRFHHPTVMPPHRVPPAQRFHQRADLRVEPHGTVR